MEGKIKNESEVRNLFRNHYSSAVRALLDTNLTVLEKTARRITVDPEKFPDQQHLNGAVHVQVVPEGCSEHLATYVLLDLLNLKGKKIEVQ